MAGKATHRPWRYRELGSEGAMIYPDCADKRESGKPICRVEMRDTLTDFANARFIVRAVNAHDVLVEVFKTIQTHVFAWEESRMDEQDLLDKFFELFHILRTLVAQAKGD